MKLYGFYYVFIGQTYLKLARGIHFAHDCRDSMSAWDNDIKLSGIREIEYIIN